MTQGTALHAMEDPSYDADSEKTCRTCHYLLKNYQWCYHDTQKAPKEPNESCEYWTRDQFRSIRIPI